VAYTRVRLLRLAADKYLAERLYAVVREHAAGRPTLVFCNSRKTCKDAASQVAGAAGHALLQSNAHQQRLLQAASGLADRSLAALVRGV
jgi:replicative superfamily II helicase